MKHHEYQIYYGGFKIKLKNIKYCPDCKNTIQSGFIYNKHQHELQIEIMLRSQKKQTGLPRYKLKYKKWNVIPKKN